MVQYKTSPQISVTYFISLRLVKVFGIWATRNTFMLKDWIKDTFTAHSLLLPNWVLVSYLD